MQLIMTVELEEPAGTELFVGMGEKAGHRSCFLLQLTDIWSDVAVLCALVPMSEQTEQ